MAYTVTTDGQITINLAPQTVVEEVLQNLSMILSTTKYSVPLDRNFGLFAHFVDKPTSVAEALIVSEILDAIEKYESRAEVLDVFVERDEMTGKIILRLEVDIIGG